MNKLKLTEYDKGFITGYATALQDLLFDITGENMCGKSYDPCEIDEEYIHSYAYNLKDGGRHHHISDYKSVEEIVEIMFNEVKRMLEVNKHE